MGTPEDGVVESNWGVALRALAWAAAAAALLEPVALPIGMGGGLAGAVAATCLASRVARSPVRLGWIWLACLVALLLGVAVGGWLTGAELVARWLGVEWAQSAADLVRFAIGAAAIVLALRVTAWRYGIAAVLEFALIALALSSLLAMHRNGAINHPRVLADWALLRGRDPRQFLFLAGGATLLALALALLYEQRGRAPRLLLHLATVAAMALLALLGSWFGRLPAPPRGQGGLGQQERGRGSPRGGSGGPSEKRSTDQDLEFRDDYRSPSHQAPVAVVLLHDDYSPPLGYYYFRQTAFSQFNGRRLVAATRDDIDRDLVLDFPTERVRVVGAPPLGPERLQVRTTVALLADHVRPFGLESPAEFSPREVPEGTGAEFTRSYEVVSSALAVRYEELLGRKTVRLGRAASVYTEMPKDPRYRQLADEIIRTTLRPEFASDPFAQALAISAWLGKHSSYSMRSKHATADDPAADFLFGDRIGYCVHFSHAAAYLLRARGLPARIAAGYVADEGRKGSGSSILLRQKDAHAWAELWLDGFGWIVVDVSPENILDPPDTPPDPDLQRMLGEMARGDRHGGKVASPQDQSTQDLARLGRVLVRGALLLLALALSLLYAIKIWRRLAPALVGAGQIHRVAYRSALDRLAEVGLVRGWGETRESFASRMMALAPSFDPLTRAHVARAFGGATLPAPRETRHWAGRVAREVRGRTPWWKTLLGWINPSSWLMSR